MARQLREAVARQDASGRIAGSCDPIESETECVAQSISDNLSGLGFGGLVWFLLEVLFELLQRYPGKTTRRALANC